VPRAHPVLPGEQRSHRDIPSAHEIGMEGVMALLTDKEQALIGTVRLAGMPTHGTRLTRIMGVYLDRHRTLQEGLVGNHALQFGKAPFGVRRIGLALRACRLLAAFAPRALSDVCQIFQADQAVRVLSHDVCRDLVIGVGFQPSLSPTDRHKATGSRASAFLLQTLSQSRVMVGFGNDVFPAMEGTSSFRVAGYGQIAHADIHASNAGVSFGQGISRLDFQGHQQVKGFLGVIVPEFSRADVRAMLNEREVLFVASVGNDDAAFQCQDTRE
jgi:hypothetical protein